MARSSVDPYTFASDLATIDAQLARGPQQADELLSIGRRLSRVGSEIALACERAFLAASEEIAA